MRVAAWLGSCTAIGALTAAVLVAPAQAQSTTTTSPSPVTTSCTPTTTTTTSSTTTTTTTSSTTTTTTTTTPPTTTTSPPTTSSSSDPCRPSDDKNCSDFATPQEAQTYFLSKGGSTTNNVDRLDANRNGVACEDAADDGDDPNPAVTSNGDDGSTSNGDQVKDVPIGSAQTGGA